MADKNIRNLGAFVCSLPACGKPFTMRRQTSDFPVCPECRAVQEAEAAVERRRQKRARQRAARQQTASATA